MNPWVSFLKWILQPKNALLSLLVVVALVLALTYLFKAQALTEAQTRITNLNGQIQVYSAQNDMLRANIESIKKQAAKVQVIEKKTHTIREIVNQLPGKDCTNENSETKKKFQQAAVAIIDYFNAGRLPSETNSEAGSKILPSSSEAGPIGTGQ